MRIFYPSSSCLFLLSFNLRNPPPRILPSTRCSFLKSTTLAFSLSLFHGNWTRLSDSSHNLCGCFSSFIYSTILSEIVQSERIILPDKCECAICNQHWYVDVIVGVDRSPVIVFAINPFAISRWLHSQLMRSQLIDLAVGFNFDSRLGRSRENPAELAIRDLSGIPRIIRWN